MTSVFEIRRENSKTVKIYEIEINFQYLSQDAILKLKEKAKLFVRKSTQWYEI